MEYVSIIAVEIGDLVVIFELFKANNACVLLLWFGSAFLVLVLAYSAHGGLCHRNSVYCIPHVELSLILKNDGNHDTKAAERQAANSDQEKRVKKANYTAKGHKEPVVGWPVDIILPALDNFGPEYNDSSPDHKRREEHGIKGCKDGLRCPVKRERFFNAETDTDNSKKADQKEDEVDLKQYPCHKQMVAALPDSFHFREDTCAQQCDHNQIDNDQQCIVLCNLDSLLARCDSIILGHSLLLSPLKLNISVVMGLTHELFCTLSQRVVSACPDQARWRRTVSCRYVLPIMWSWLGLNEVAIIKSLSA